MTNERHRREQGVTKQSVQKKVIRMANKGIYSRERKGGVQKTAYRKRQSEK